MTGFDTFFGFLVGVFFTLYVHILFYKSSNDSSDQRDRDREQKKFYLNIFLLNTKDVLQNIVRQKVSRNRPVLRALAKKLVVRLIKDELLAKRVGADLCNQIPLKLWKKGVPVNATIVYQRSAFICIEIVINTVSISTFFKCNEQQKIMSPKYDALISKLNYWANVEPFLNRMFTGFIAKKLQSQIPEMIISKLQMKLNAKLELVVCEDDEQGDFLIQTMQELSLNPSDAAANMSSPSVRMNSPIQ